MTTYDACKELERLRTERAELLAALHKALIYLDENTPLKVFEHFQALIDKVEA